MCCLTHLVLGRCTIKRNVEAGMGMGGNGNESSVGFSGMVFQMCKFRE